jgi:predicted nucleic acid-binding protein
MPEEVVNETLAILARRTHLIRITARVAGIASHAEDDLVIATAVSGDAEYLITGDKRLRKVGKYQNVKIRTPQEFLAEFEEATSG